MKFSKMCAVTALTVVGMAGSALATPTVSFVRNNAVNPAGFNGGEFLANFSNGSQYRAFCLERSIVFSPNNPYGYNITNGDAISGGPGGNPDPVAAATAWVFTQWLSGATFGIADVFQRNVAVQLAIWNIEQEGGSLSLAGTYGPGADGQLILNQIPVAYQNYSLNAEGLPEFSNIRVVNPTNLDGTGDYQSMIILIPLPAASGMALAGLALVGGIRRRK